MTKPYDTPTDNVYFLTFCVYRDAFEFLRKPESKLCTNVWEICFDDLWKAESLLVIAWK